jgi:hypothetical protein
MVTVCAHASLGGLQLSLHPVAILSVHRSALCVWGIWDHTKNWCYSPAEVVKWLRGEGTVGPNLDHLKLHDVQSSLFNHFFLSWLALLAYSSGQAELFSTLGVCILVQEAKPGETGLVLHVPSSS